ncbi:MAG: PHP domain-containing protein [Clostridiales bacterium]|nr:PHP domain-containing protein [Clostridiales bacterium]
MDKNLPLLNAKTAEERLENAKKIAKETVFPKSEFDDVNGHIHTTYSFSPYSPTASVYMAKMSGLRTAGIMDHDSVGGAKEFLSAGEIFGLPLTVGMECRVSVKGTAFETKKINNPDQVGCAYITVHGLPHDQIDKLNAIYAPYRAYRNERNIAMVERINELFGKYDIKLDFEGDVLPLSEYATGGTVTERHISSALAGKLIDVFGKGEKLISFITDTLKLSPSKKVMGYLADSQNEHYLYDLIGVIKSDIIGAFYIPADKELMHITDFADIMNSLDAVPCIPYLGDIAGESVTGDKKAQVFEDAFLDEWVEYCKSIGFKGITFAPSRNTLPQIERLRGLVRKFGLMEISGEDINTSRQSFVCTKMREDDFETLRHSAYAIIAHERRATYNKADSFFGANTAREFPDWENRLISFADMIRK